MRTLKSILVATDFQRTSEDALNATARLATTFNSLVSVLHVMEPFSKGVVASMREQLKQSLLVPALEGLVASHEILGETAEAERYRHRLESARSVAHPHLDSRDVGF